MTQRWCGGEGAEMRAMKDETKKGGKAEIIVTMTSIL